MPFDLAFFGRQAVDLDNWQTSIRVAELLDLPCITAVGKLEVGDSAVKAWRNVEGGRELVEAALPLLISADEMHALLGESGFVAECFEDASDMILNSPHPVSVTPAATAPAVNAQAQLGLSVFVDNLSEKAGNARRSLQEGRVRFVRGVFRAE